MADKILNAFDVWITAQGVKSRTRLRSVDNISLEGVARLRELILNLAVEGKLVYQDTNEESANILLKKFKLENDKKWSVIKNQKVEKEITAGEMIFSLPVGWAWERFGNIALIERGGSPRPINSFLTNDSDGLNWIKIGDTDIGGKYITKTEEKIRREGLVKTRMVYPGDFLLTNSMSFGRPYITKIEGCIHDGWLRIHPPDILDKDFLYHLLSSPYVKRFFQSAAAGAVVQNLNADKVRELPIPIPPLAEQHRIVAKVDELMALCDALEQQEAHHLKSHQLLVETLLGTLTRAADAKEFQHAWNKLYEHFDDLFTTEDSIDQLKQTILQLAVMGKLVPQDPNDEPASELLKRIAKERLSVKKKKDEEESYQILESEKLFYLPTNWSWCKFGQLVRFMAYGTSQKTNDNAEDVPVLRMGNITSEGKLVYNNLKYISPDHEDLPALYLENGDIVFNRTNSYDLVGKSGVYNEGPNRYTLASYLIKVSPFIRLTNSEFLNLYINSPLCRRTQIEPQITAQTNQANFSGSKLRSIVVPLPPLNEQARIINKVNELFALCYRLKERIGEAQKVANQMAEGVVV